MASPLGLATLRVTVADEWVMSSASTDNTKGGGGMVKVASTTPVEKLLSNDASSSYLVSAVRLLSAKVTGDDDAALDTVVQVVVPVLRWRM